MTEQLSVKDIPRVTVEVETDLRFGVVVLDLPYVVVEVMDSDIEG